MHERFGKYELLRRIGVGGMAEVFVAKTHGAQGFVKHLVIKRILPAFNEDPDFVRMFINEAHLAARLDHANIVQIFDFDHVDETYYIAMEWVDGTDLRRIHNTSRRREIPMPVNVAVHCGVETLKGLHYAHTKTDAGRPLRIVHRDISPHNLLVSFSGEVKIADFGIAKVAALAGATKSGAVKGKLTYMSPEQINGETVDARTDIFATGIVLWELLARRRLYNRAGSEGELMAAVRRADIPALESVNPEIDAGLARVVDRMLAPNPDDRYGGAAEALGDLSSFANISDALDLSDYLKRLLPEEANRDSRGQTESHAPPTYGEAAPSAPTRTAAADSSAEGLSLAGLSAAAEQPPSEPSPGQSELLAARGSHETRPSSVSIAHDATIASQRLHETRTRMPDGVELASPSQRTAPPAPPAPRGGAGRWLLALLLLLAAGAGSWLLAGELGVGRSASRRRALAPVATLRITSTPPGAAVTVAGLALSERTPLALRGPAGKAVTVRLSLGGAVKTIIGRFGGAPVSAALGARGGGATSGSAAAGHGGGSHVTAAAGGNSGSGSGSASAAARASTPAAPKKAGNGKRPRRPAAKNNAKGRDRDAARKARAGDAARIRAIERLRARVAAARKRRRRPRAFGTLAVFVHPWAKVLVDGRKKALLTPLKALELPVGTHRVRLKNPYFKFDKVRTVRIHRGKTTRIFITLRKR